MEVRWFAVCGAAAAALTWYLWRKSNHHSENRASAVCRGFVGAVGNTKMVLLPALSEAVGSDILVKLEYSNPGFSIKDRAARLFGKPAVSSFG